MRCDAGISAWALLRESVAWYHSTKNDATRLRDCTWSARRNRTITPPDTPRDVDLLPC
jgi:hypothetical protein